MLEWNSRATATWIDYRRHPTGRTNPTVTEMKRTESIASEAAILVGVLLTERTDYEHPLDELEGLAETAGRGSSGG